MQGFPPLDSETEGLDMLGIKVHVIDGHKSCCASQGKDQFFILIIVLWCACFQTLSECGET